MNKPKQIGTAAETAVVRYLRPNGFPQAERRALRGTLDAGDITGCPGICIEVKGGNAARTASDLMIQRWLDELAAEIVNADADAGILVVQRAGVGPANAGRWWAYMPAWQLASLMSAELVDALASAFPVRMLLADAVTLLRAAGYGTPTDPHPHCGHELHGADGGPCPACGHDSHPIPTTPAPPTGPAPWEVTPR